MSPSKAKKKAAPTPIRSKKEARKEVHSLEPVESPAPSNARLQQQQQEGRYVYGVIEAREPLSFGKIGIGGAGENVYTVHHGDVAAVVSKTPVFIFDPTRENALAHEHVIETVMKNNTIIPMSFGTVFRTDDDIREVLKSIYPSLKDVLKQMANKLEFGLKVTWDRPHRGRTQARKRRDPPLPARAHAQAPAVHLLCPHAAWPHDR